MTVTPQAGRIKAPVSVNNIKCAKALASRRRTVQCTEQACMGGQTCRNVSVGGAEGNVGVPSFVRPLPAFLSQEQLDGTESCFIMLLHLLSETETSCLYRRWCRTFSLTLHISHSAPCSLHGDAHVLTNLGKMFDGKVSPCNYILCLLNFYITANYLHPLIMNADWWHLSVINTLSWAQWCSSRETRCVNGLIYKRCTFSGIMVYSVSVITCLTAEMDVCV